MNENIENTFMEGTESKWLEWNILREKKENKA